MNDILRPDPVGMRVLAAAGKAWNEGASLRQRRERYKRFTYGDQWSDVVTDADGTVMTEGDLERRRGKRPMSNNLIRRLVKCIVGRFRMMVEEQGWHDDFLGGLYVKNNLDELDSRALEEFLISGCAIQRVVCERRPHGKGVFVDNVSPARFFVNAMKDPRGWDIELVGLVHDMSPAEVVMRFSKGDVSRASALRRHYSSLASSAGLFVGGSFANAPEGRCRVIEAWTLEAVESLRCHDTLKATCFDVPSSELPRIEAENNARGLSQLPGIQAKWMVSTRWHCRWIAPDGTVLDEYDSPFFHAGHPFVVKFYPLTDGEVHSLVEDVIDQQVYVNRLITLIDHLMGTSAKGALLFPVEQKLKGMDWSEIGRIWASPDGILPYAGMTGAPEPHQLSTNAADIGARELLTLEMKMFEDVSGVSNALMGKTSGGGNVGAERYESEVRNATVAINDLLKTFMHFRKMRDEKMQSVNSGNVG